jgi:DNA-binding IclR family transcriptional regulator
VENVLGSKARLKVLKALALNSELSITQIIKKTKLNHKNVIKHLNHLITLNLVQEKRFGRIKIFRYRFENLKAKSLKNFINIWESDLYTNDHNI